jgi:ketosteroid isomerase-like protein
MNHALVDTFYAALQAGDRGTVEALLHSDFTAAFAAGLPYGIGGTYRGTEAIERGWWAIGRAFAITARRDEYVDCTDGRLLVLGRYIGSDRRTHHEIDAAFTHLWSAAEGKLRTLHQLTDTACWTA